MLFKPGDAVPEAGIYEAIHRAHREAHHVSIGAGAVFPDCNSCDGAVRFRFLRAATPIDRDEDFR